MFSDCVSVSLLGVGLISVVRCVLGVLVKV